jgi:polyisoprenyl-phosphate glycosyltransferase
MSTKPLISCIIVFLNEERNLPAAYEEAVKLESLVPNCRLEIIFVDDGSTDGSWNIAKGFAAGDSRCRAVRLTRNFGAVPALMAGMAESRGDWIIDMAADGQDPVEMFADLVKMNIAKRYDVSWGLRRTRKDSLRTRFFSRISYSLMRRWALDSFPREGLDAFCCSRRVADYLARHYTASSNLHMLLFWANFRGGRLRYDRRERRWGRSKWSLGKKVYLFINSFVSFSYLPLRLVTLAGIFWLIASAAWTGYIVIDTLLTGSQVAGFPSLMAVILFGMGSILFGLGIISEYLWRALDIMKGMPLYVVQEKVGGEEGT